MNKGLLISLSGPDGSGKSTLIEGICSCLGESSREPAVLWSRLGYTPGIEFLKAVIRRFLGSAVPQRGDGDGRDRAMGRRPVQMVWLAAACIDLLFTYGVRARAMTRRGRVVVCDRYVWDALIDQRMFFPGNRWASHVIRCGFQLIGRRPDLALLLLLPFETAQRRSESKKEPFPDPPKLRLARHRLYGELEEGGFMHVLDATRTPEELTNEVVGLLRDR